MADYTLIFVVFLIFDGLVTLRASALWPRIRSSLSGGSHLATSSEHTSLVSERLDVNKSASAEYRRLLYSYLVVYLLATLSDWLQGPYVYALYDAYGFSPHEIAILFVAGFGSSMIFGSFVGGLADSCGRKKFVLLFCVIYAIGCATKHVRNFGVLMLGRLMGGIATSLLFSVFDTWYIKAHNTARFDKALIANTFSYAAYGNSIIAILAGLLANKIANASTMTRFIDDRPFTLSDYTTAHGHSTTDIYLGGFIGPFDLAFGALVLCFLVASLLWEENYGEQPSDVSRSSSHSEVDDAEMADSDSSTPLAAKQDRPKGKETIAAGWKRALNTTMQNRQVLLCGIISSLFEGSMYVFVFMWTRSLKSLTPGMEESGGHRRTLQEVSLPFGLIFSTFMVCCMAGSSIFSICMECKVSLEYLAWVIFAIASVCMMVVAISTSDTITFFAMNVFEMTVGIYFPTMGTLKSSIVPENSRSAIYNIYRIPLNFIVLTSLLTDLSVTASFLACAAMLATAHILQLQLRHLRQASEGSRSTTRPMVEVTIQASSE